MNYHTNITGPSIEALKFSFAKAVALAIHGNSKQVAIAVHTKQNLDGIIRNALGDSAVKILLKKPLVVGGVFVHLITEKIPATGFTKGVILAAHVSTRFLNNLLTDIRATDVVYVPWTPEELKTYLARYNSTQL